MELKELIERVKAATGPDRELDSDLGFTLGWYANGYEFYAWAEADGTFVESVNPKPFTASIDAALALTQRVLPGWTLARLSQDDHKLWYVELRQGHATSYGRVVIAPSTIHGLPLPLAIILALLTALDQKEENK